MYQCDLLFHQVMFDAHYSVMSVKIHLYFVKS